MDWPIFFIIFSALFSKLALAKLASTSCPDATASRTVSKKGESQTYCAIILDSSEIEIMRRHFTNEKNLLSNRYRRVDSKLQADDMCRNVSMFADLAPGIVKGKSAKYYDSWKYIYPKSGYQFFNTPVASNDEDIESIIKMMDKYADAVLKRKWYQFFVNTTTNNVRAFQPPDKQYYEKVNRVPATECGYYVRNDNYPKDYTGLHLLQCKQPFVETDGSVTKQEQIVICEFKAVRDCEYRLANICVLHDPKNCKMTPNLTILHPPPHRLGKPCPPEPPRVQEKEISLLPGCEDTTEIAKKCKRDCVLGDWSEWSECSNEVKNCDCKAGCMTRRKPITRAQSFGGLCFPGNTFEKETCCRGIKNECPLMKIMTLMVILLIGSW